LLVVGYSLVALALASVTTRLFGPFAVDPTVRLTSTAVVATAVIAAVPAYFGRELSVGGARVGPELFATAAAVLVAVSWAYAGLAGAAFLFARVDLPGRVVVVLASGVGLVLLGWLLRSLLDDAEATDSPGPPD
jgi:hypothetical protein